MKRMVIMIGMVLSLALPALAQNNGEVGAYGDYSRLGSGNSATDYVGIGGRVGVNVTSAVVLEAEMNYDFARNVTSTNSNGGSTSFAETSVRPLTGLFGPKLQVGGARAFRAFITGKAGFINFGTSTSGAVSGTTFTNSVTGVGGSGTYLAFYPGGGVEGFLGPIGLRLDAGDEIYMDNGAHNNLRVTFGPTIRF